MQMELRLGDDENMTVRVVVIGNHLLALQAVSATLRGNPDIEVVTRDTGEANLLRVTRETRPDIVIIDFSVRTPALDPGMAVEVLKQACPTVEILALIGHNDSASVRGIIDAGARGCLFSDDEQLLSLSTVLRRIARGERTYSQAVLEGYMNHPYCALTPHQLAVLRLAAEGLSDRTIAKRLAISPQTVRNHLCNIYTRLGVSSQTGMNRRVGAINRAKRLGLV
jgi:two-component system response regulator DesR